MKKLILFILALTISISALAIPDFEGIDWGNTKEEVTKVLKNSKKYPSINPDTEVLILNISNQGVKNYKLFFKKNHLFKIRVSFDKEKIGKDEMKIIYKKLVLNLGNPVKTMPINEKITSSTIKGNYIQFSPDSKTNVYYVGVDTINKTGDMTDSNLYLEYLPASKDYAFEM